MKPLIVVPILILVALSTCCVSTEPTNLTYADAFARNVWITTGDNHMCSGVILSTGRILTAKHCRADIMKVDGVPATVERASTKYDLLLLNTKTASFAPDRFSTRIAVSDRVFAFVNTDIYKSVYTTGRVMWFDDERIFSSTEAAPGISGSALRDMNGRIVGLSNQIHGVGLILGSPSSFDMASSVPAKRIEEFLAEIR